MKKIRIILSVVAIGILLLVGCGVKEGGNTVQNETSSSEGNGVVRVCFTGVYVSSTSIIMKEKNILEKYLPDGVEVEWSQIATGPDIRDALVAGKVDIADFSLMTFITSMENDLPLTLMSFMGSTPIKLYSHDENIKSISDFSSGDSISITNKNTNLHMAFLALCNQEFGNSTELDNNLVAIPAADALASLETADDYAGAVFSFPMSVQADANEKLILLNDMTDLIKEYSIGDVCVAESDFYQNNPEIIEAFLKAQEEAIEYITGNPEEAAQILVKYFNCEEADIVDAIAQCPPTNKVTGYDKQAQLLYEAGILTEEPVKMEELYNYDEIVK